ncbi:MAG: STAS domain-containing protein [Clostridium sp.]|jgi:anti-sigma B factor antagonist|nr:STAS domain-containing protein [Clostridium sp.]
MTITKNQEGSKVTVKLEGRLDTMTAPELEKCLAESLDGITDLTFDMEGLEYISSAGLRVLLATQKTMNKQGSMKVIHVQEMVMEVFEVTGFNDILTIE